MFPLVCPIRRRFVLSADRISQKKPRAAKNDAEASLFVYARGTTTNRKAAVDFTHWRADNRIEFTALQHEYSLGDSRKWTTRRIEHISGRHFATIHVPAKHAFFGKKH